MGNRAVFVYGVAFLAWAFACSASFGTNGFNLLLGSFGAVVGLVYGGVITLWQLRTIEKNGEYKATRKIWAFILLAIIVIVPLALYFAFSLGLAGAKQMVSFVFLIGAATYATQTGLYLNLERKQKKRILFEGCISTRVYASPETEKR